MLDNKQGNDCHAAHFSYSDKVQVSLQIICIHEKNEYFQQKTQAVFKYMCTTPETAAKVLVNVNEPNTFFTKEITNGQTFKMNMNTVRTCTVNVAHGKTIFTHQYCVHTLYNTTS